MVVSTNLVQQSLSLPLMEIASGSVTGYEHLRLGRNNQDAWAVQDFPLVSLAVVADGCGGMPHSEVGAQIGVRLVLQSVHRYVQEGRVREWSLIQAEILAHLHHFAQSMGGDLGQTVEEYFLFTLVGAVVTPVETTLFWLGDGVVAFNDNWQVLPTFPDNAPPYLAYGILGGEVDPFQTWILPTQEWRSLLIGTDGLKDFIAAAEVEPVGDLSQFWTEDRYFHNPDQVRRQLARWNRESKTRSRLLPDDTTLVVMRRAGEAP